VTAVGGTTLQQATDTGTRDAVETTWSGSGSGCSAYESKPAWQTDTGCANRTNNDVSAIADPNTGVWVYDSFDASSGSWGVFGGTSVATPIVGSMYALANNGASSTAMNSLPYKDKTALNDVTSGSNGSCSVTELCNAGVGYDAPTGLGTPNGIGAFSLSSVSSSTAPGAPTGLTATAGTGVINLSWTAPSNGGSAITGYNIYRGTTSSGETLLASAGTGTTYADSSVTNGTPYFYEVTAVNAIGEGARSSETTATPVAPATDPSAPTSLVATSGTGVINLSWTAPSNGGSAITGYNIYRGGSSGTETLLTRVGTGTTYADSSVTNGTPYFYEVTAVNGVGEGARSNEATATPQVVITAPSAPTSLAATSGNAVVNLSWTAPSNNGGSAITGYDIYRGTSSGGETLYASVGTGTTYADSSVSNGTPYYYEVAAVNGIGAGAKSNQASATLTAPATVPGAPQNLSGRASRSSFTLNWSAPSNNGGSAITGYAIYRSTTSGAEVLIATVGTSTTYQDGIPPFGRTYYYEVAAINAVGTGPRSNQAAT